MATTKQPVTTGGWYELEDGRVQRFSWLDGQLLGGEIVDSWETVPSDSERWDDRGYHASKA